MTTRRAYLISVLLMAPCFVLLTVSTDTASADPLEAPPAIATLGPLEQSMPLPVQGVLLDKVLVYVVSLHEAKGDQLLLVPYRGNKSDAQAKLEPLTNQIKRRTVTFASMEELVGLLGKSTAVYLHPDLDIERVAALSAAAGALTVTGIATLVRSGHAAVGFDRSADNKPEIVIHLKRLRSEGHQVNSTLLGLAKVIK